jgi:hypothetical protein
MKYIFLTLLVCLQAAAQKNEVNVSSTIEKATVFFQGVQLEHTGSFEVKSGKQTVVLEKLTDFIDPNSVQVKAQGDVTILSVKTRKNFEDVRISEAQMEALNANKRKLELKDIALRDEYHILELDKQLLLKNRDLKGQQEGLKVAELKEAYAFMHQKLTEINVRESAIYEELEQLNKDINKIEQEIFSQRSKPVINYTEIVVELDAKAPTKGTFYFSYISPNASWTPYYDMRSDGIGAQVKLEAKALVNQTTGIPWKDIDLVLSTNDPYDNSTEPQITPWYLSYYNYPAQKQISSRQLPAYSYGGQLLKGEVIDASTGEALPFARITFPSNSALGAVTDVDGKFEVTVPKNESYATASFVGYGSVQLPITAPYLKFFLYPEALELNEVVISEAEEKNVSNDDWGVEDQLSRYEGVEIGNRSKRKVENDKSKIAQIATGASSTFSWSSNAASVVTQKDLRVEYAIQSKFSIASDGMEQRVAIASYELPANYEYHTAPKIDPSVYLSAQVTGWDKLNLLNGESNLYFDGTFIGKTYIDVNSTKDTIGFSLGKDQKIQIERKRIQEKSTNRVIGSRQKFEVTWEINVRNNGGASIPILIKDQFPISIDNDIKVKQGEYGDGNLDEKTGILTWRYNLVPSASKTINFNYTVDSEHGKVLYIE